MRRSLLRAPVNSLEPAATPTPMDDVYHDRDAIPSEPVESDALAKAVDELLALVGPESTPRLPSSTYRVQFHAHCTFQAAERAVGYLAKLGISDLYAAPFLQARPGSVHGYDIVNHGAVNPEIGTRDDLQTLSAALKSRELGLIADVVPNHMCASPILNGWWQDVLENGPSSTYAGHFDIDWMPLKPDLADKVLLPVLGDQFGKVLEDGQLVVNYEEGSFWLDYFEHRFPISPRSYALILSPNLEQLEQRLGSEAPELLELLSILTAIKNLPDRSETDPERLVERRREKEVIKRRLNDLTLDAPLVADHLQGNLRLINGQPGQPDSFELLDELLTAQAYRLSYWRTATDEINYRRFFDINELAAICTESPEVFTETHALILELLDENIITGLRIDHPDGLYDPQGYLYHLQEQFYRQRCRRAIARWRSAHPDQADITDDRLEARLLELWHAATQIPGSPLSRPLYIVAEKILAGDEELPHDWPVHGTVGYEFLNAVNGLFVDPRGERPITNTFARFTGEALDFDDLAYRCKRLIVRMSMASEINVLGHQLDRISERNRWTRDFTLSSQTRALQEVIAGFSVYRTYVRLNHVLERDRLYIERAVALAKKRNPAMNASVFDFVRDVLLLQFQSNADDAEMSLIERFVGKFQQVTGPIMAKAVEDTAFYRYNRLVSLNEVGGEPEHFGLSVDKFHRWNQARLPWQSHAMNASSTHDTKRSEDVRARISVISEVPKPWRDLLQKWARAHRKLKTPLDGVEAPDANAEYLLYQTLIGIWPDELPQGDERKGFISRVQQYMLKVVREAKSHTSWISPVEPYEQALALFIERLFADDRRRPFLQELHEFAVKVADHGRWNSLSQLVLKLMSPGVADFYQGSELWNLTLVDPDNRQPVDFAGLEQTLDQLIADCGALLPASDPHGDVVSAWLQQSWDGGTAAGDVADWLRELVEARTNGRIKLFTTLLGLQLRRTVGELLTSGQYIPLPTSGKFADHLVAFARDDGQRRAIVVVPRLTVGVVGFGGGPPLGDVWEDTSVHLPECLSDWEPSSVGYRNLFTLGEVHPALVDVGSNAQTNGDVHTASIPAATLFQNFPVAVLLAARPTGG